MSLTTVRSAANTIQIGLGSTAVILGANSGALTITDASSNVTQIVPGVALGSGGGSGANTSISNVAFTSANNNLKILTEDSRTFSIDLSALSGGSGGTNTSVVFGYDIIFGR